MSGKIVGEVLAAAPRLRDMGLSERSFHALVAIAEKCHHQTRQGSVRWDHIRNGLYGASKRTAERAVHELRDAGLVTVSATGYGNQHMARAPIYRVAALPVTDIAVSESPPPLTDTVVSESSESAYRQHKSAYRQTESAYRHLGVVLDGPIDGPIDGEPPRYCPDHPNDTDRKCGPCKTARLKHEQWQAEQTEQAAQDREARKRAREDCNICGGYWYVLGDDLTPIEPLKRCPVCKPAEAVVG